MLEWGSPLWLLAAAGVVPLIWWLHRLHLAEAVHTVSAIFLWRSQAADAPGPRRTRTDPQWPLRALIAVCLALGAAQPKWTESGGLRIEVWFDDSLSMQAQDPERTRSELAVDALVGALTGVAHGDVRVHSLGRPGQTLTLEAADKEQWGRDLRSWLRPVASDPDPPLPIQMSEESEHWLVSDGASPVIASWLESAPIGRSLQVGTITENVAVTRLALRRSLHDPDIVAGLVEVANLGKRPTRRRLAVLVGEHALLDEEVSLTAGQTVQRRIEVDSAGMPGLRAEISPPDALRADDELAVVPGSVGRVPLRLEGACGSHLRAALMAHPGVRPAGALDNDPALFVVCGLLAPPVGEAVLWISPSDVGRPVDSLPVWQPSAGRLRELMLRPEWLRDTGALTDTAGLRPILIAGREPLILAGPGPRRTVLVRLDLEAAELVRRPEYPALVAGLLDLAHGRPLLDVTAVRTRSLAASTIAPQSLPPPRGPVRTGVLRTAVDLTPYALSAALLLLIADMARHAVRRGGRRGAAAGI